MSSPASLFPHHTGHHAPRGVVDPTGFTSILSAVPTHTVDVHNVKDHQQSLQSPDWEHKEPPSGIPTTLVTSYSKAKTTTNSANPTASQEPDYGILAELYPSYANLVKAMDDLEDAMNDSGVHNELTDYLHLKEKNGELQRDHRFAVDYRGDAEREKYFAAVKEFVRVKVGKQTQPSYIPPDMGDDFDDYPEPERSKLRKSQSMPSRKSKVEEMD